MSHAIEWFGFAGAWLLMAGPIYQAALELEEEDFDREEMTSALEGLAPQAPISPWWWLFPPVAYLLRRRRRESRRRELLEILDADQLERLMHFSQTATGWFYVAGGAALLAIKETAELQEAYEWPTWAAVLLIVAMLFLSAANTAFRVQRRDAILAKGRD